MATSFDIEVEQGGNYSATLIASGNNAALNLSNYGLSGQVRYQYGSTGILLNLGANITTGVAGVTGHFILTLDSSDLNLPFGRFLYDIEAYSGVQVYKLYKGNFDVLPEVTF
jgi:hypothetical protein